MSHFRSHPSRAAMVLACLAAGGCSMLRHEARPATPGPAASARAAAPHAASAPASAARPADASWDPVAVHLDPAALVGHTWVFPSSSPVRYGDDRFAFKRDRVEASNAHEHATGTWTVERDKLCITLNASAWGSACYAVTGIPPDKLQIRALPGGERLPLKIE